MFLWGGELGQNGGVFTEGELGWLWGSPIVPMEGGIRAAPSPFLSPPSRAVPPCLSLLSFDCERLERKVGAGGGGGGGFLFGSKSGVLGLVGGPQPQFGVP